ncbi:MAG: dTDP-4-dehydrorhamnose reductase [Tidjanibacter sp.]|nr:dTDP-4-dehydrorhamnose reductase [Tidjanibacter sp.]
MRILVTGAEGQLGRSVRRAVERGYGVASDDYLFTDVAELDITNREAVLGYVADNHIDIIINCAAYTNVERAEEDEERAHMLNAVAVGYLAEAAKRNDALLVHISTDYVFMGGCCAMLTEESNPQPVNAYGRTKLAGERTVQASGCHHIIVRTAWLYSEFGANFVKTMLRLTAERESVRVVSDQLGTPTYAGDLAEALVGIITERNFREGLYHYTDLGECSWWQFAKEIARLAGHEGCEIVPCTTAEYGARAARPHYAVLDKKKFMTTFGVSIPEWRESLKKCLDELQA